MDFPPFFPPTAGPPSLFIQVAGYKYVRVLAPTEAKHLYPYGESNVIATTGRYVGQRNVSQVDNIEAPDVARFPLALEAKYVDVVLGPGDSLYMPSGWWHYVRSLTPSISVNFWFEKDPDATAAAK
jgi:lysine-specific demethylase 8